MTNEKILEVIALYRGTFQSLRAPKEEFPKDQFPDRDRAAIEFLDEWHHHLAHCHRMLDEMERFVAEGRIEKAFRWLGFIQGVLWSAGVYTVEEMANHNRP